MRFTYIGVFACVLSGCATNGLGPEAPEPTIGEVLPGVVSRFTAPRAVREQDSVPMRLVIRNETDSTITFIIPGNPTLHGTVEFRVEDASGTVVFNSMHGVEPLLIGLGPVDLQPGDSLTFSFTWGLERSSSDMDLPPWFFQNYEGPYVTPGEYRLWAVLNTRPDRKHLPKRPLEVLPAR